MYSRTVTRRDQLKASTSIVSTGALSVIGCLQRSSGSGEQGNWYTPDGERFTLTIKTPSNGTWPLNAKTADRTLTDFGIDTESILRDSAAYGQDVRQSNFTMAINVWGGTSGQSRHPFSFFSTVFGPDRARIGQFDPTSLSVPYPIGDPSGERRAVNASQKVEELGQSDGSGEEDLITELAWIYNQSLPRLPLMNGINRAWMTNDEWDIPPKSSQYMRDNAVRLSLKMGKVTATNESKTVFRLPTRVSNPNDIQWNPYFVTGGSGGADNFMFEQIANMGVMPLDVSDVSIPDKTKILAESIQTGEEEIRIELKDNRVWTDGKPLTAEDVAIHYRLADQMGQASGELWDAISIENEYTILFEIGGRNPAVVSSIFSDLIRTKRGTKYAEWLDQFEETNSTDERTALKEEIVQTSIDSTTSYGLWQLDSVSNSRIRLSIREEHPRSDDVNFDAIEMPAISSNQKRWASLNQGRIDALPASSTPRSIEERFPDHAVRIPYENTLGDGIIFNHGREPFTDGRVRKAIAFLINRWTNTHNAKDFVSTIERPVGLPNREAKKFLGDELKKCQRYGYKESRPEEAARLLRDAGYTRR
jgi:peptide/nickel transport system substrate-binding protein